MSLKLFCAGAAVGAWVLPATTLWGQAGNILIAGTQGPDYSLLVSSNLSSWQILFMTNSPLLPVTIMETNSGKLTARFYRVQIGP